MRAEKWVGGVVLVFGVLTLGVGSGVAQSQVSTTTSSSTCSTYSEGAHRPLVVVVRSEVVETEECHQAALDLQGYAKRHEGSYVVFSENGTRYRLDKPELMAEIEALSKPMQELAAQQSVLAKQQQPLAAEQRELSEKMKATHSPDEIGRIGKEMGQVGQEQGEIGKQQGAIGKQQGNAGRALHDRIQALIDACLRDHSCPVA